MPATSLFAPERHAPLVEERWNDGRARVLLEGLVTRLAGAYRGLDELWPNHSADLDDDPDVPWRTLYLGAGGIVWALARLERTGHPPSGLDLAAIAAALPAGLAAAPEFESLYPAPQPSLLMGSSGLHVLADAFGGEAPLRDELAASIATNEQNPTRELLWGSPGTMLAALDLFRRTGDERWADLWRASARRLLEEWRDEVWEQDMYGRQMSFAGAGHGFAGNAHTLLRGRDLLDGATVVALERRVVDTLARLAEHDDALVQWPAIVGRDAGPPARRTQWCHGAPGVIIALAGVLPREDAVDALFIGGGELTWQAGPLRANASLCHGTAGNGFALLRLFDRTGDERWLARARSFALHAVRQLHDAERTDGFGRWPLFTGAAGVALLLASCLDADPRFPVLDGVAP